MNQMCRLTVLKPQTITKFNISQTKNIEIQTLKNETLHFCFF